MSQKHSQLHAYLISAIDEIRARLGAANIGNFDFSIEATGRTLGTNETKIEYKLGYYSEQVKGGKLEPVITEFLRRKGWQEVNDAVALPAPEQPPEQF